MKKLDNKDIKKNKNIKEEITPLKKKIRILIVFSIVFLLLIVSTFIIYSNLNKESGIDGLFHMFKKKEVSTEQAVDISKKYIDLLYNVKVDEFNIVQKNEKYYFSSNIADIVLDKRNGNKYFDLITTKENANLNKDSSVEKGEEVKNTVYDEIKPSIYISTKETDKLDIKSKNDQEQIVNEVTDNKEELVLKEVKQKIYTEESKLKYKNKEELNNEDILFFKNAFKEMSEKQNILDELYKEKKVLQEKKDNIASENINSKIKEIEEDIKELKSKLKFGDEDTVNTELAINKNINEIISFIDSENNFNKDEKTYSNSTKLKDAIILAYTNDKKQIIILNNNELYLFKKVDLDEYIKNVEEKVSRVDEKAKIIKSKVFGFKDFDKYVSVQNLRIKPDLKDIDVNFYYVDNGIINKTRNIKMVFNKQNEKLLEIKVDVNTIPYSEVKINKYDAADIAFSVLKNNGLVEIDKFKDEKGYKEYNDIIERNEIEIDYTNDFFAKNNNGEEKEFVKSIEKAWKVKFKNVPYIVYIDTYYGTVIGGESV